MRRVTWPNRKQVEGTTAVVIFSVFAFAAYFCDRGCASCRQGVTRVLEVFRKVGALWKPKRTFLSTSSRIQRPEQHRGRTSRRGHRRSGTGRRGCGAVRPKPSQPLRATTSLLPRSGTSSTPIRGSRTRWRNRCARRARGLRVRRQDRADPDPHRRSGGAAQRQEGHQQAPGLSGLRAGGNGNERRAVARGEEHAAGDRVSWAAATRRCR